MHDVPAARAVERALGSRSARRRPLRPRVSSASPRSSAVASTVVLGDAALDGLTSAAASASTPRLPRLVGDRVGDVDASAVGLGRVGSMSLATGLAEGVGHQLKIRLTAPPASQSKTKISAVITTTPMTTMIVELMISCAWRPRDLLHLALDFAQVRARRGALGLRVRPAGGRCSGVRGLSVPCFAICRLICRFIDLLRVSGA